MPYKKHARQKQRNNKIRAFGIDSTIGFIWINRNNNDSSSNVSTTVM